MRRTPTTRSEAIALATRRAKSASLGTEESLQSNIVTAFASRYPALRGRLFATFQNPTPEQHGLWIALGLVPGVSDLLYIESDYHVVGIEVKQPGKVHKSAHLKRQAEWIINNCYRGGFCTSVEMFFDMIENGTNGIDPKIILEKISTKATFVF